MMRNVQHKKEAFWFYRFLSIFYDKYVNPFFWTERMREESLDLADLQPETLRTVDVGSGTGFTTQGIVRKISAKNVTCIDQSPHQMSYAKKKPDLQQCTFRLGDAEDLGFPTDTFDRYVSAGSIEYWPEPQRGIAEAFRVLKPGGKALMIGPLRPENRIGRWLADIWMLFPEENEYFRWFENAGFLDIKYRYVQPHWVLKEKYGIAIVGTKMEEGEPAIVFDAPKAENVQEKMTIGRRIRFFLRLMVGNTAGFFFIPMAIFAIAIKPLRKIWLRDINDAAKGSPDPMTIHQKISLLITGFLLIGLAGWCLLD
ncbi:MAG: methyltransferase domain-containing protein [Calditrichaeota bacterium]|nr:methyltransferase domain-containing protein [Calditrichota bacterium]